MKQDERELLIGLQKRTAESESQPYVRQLVVDLEMNGKRAAYILEKWTGRDWYDYGVNVLSGWLTDKGRAIIGDNDTAERCKKIFKREQRYVVLKVKDLDTMGPIVQDQLAAVTLAVNSHRRSLNKPLLDCVVVEKDWPQYEAVWGLIENDNLRSTDTSEGELSYVGKKTKTVALNHGDIVIRAGTHEQVTYQALLDLLLEVANECGIDNLISLAEWLPVHVEKARQTKALQEENTTLKALIDHNTECLARSVSECDQLKAQNAELDRVLEIALNEHEKAGVLGPDSRCTPDWFVDAAYVLLVKNPAACLAEHDAQVIDDFARKHFNVNGYARINYMSLQKVATDHADRLRKEANS